MGAVATCRPGTGARPAIPAVVCRIDSGIPTPPLVAPELNAETPVPPSVPGGATTPAGVPAAPVVAFTDCPACIASVPLAISGDALVTFPMVDES